MSEKLSYKLKSGKPVKAFYYVRAIGQLLVPRLWCRWRKQSLLKEVDQRPDADYIKQRVAYYNRLDTPFSIPKEDRQNRHSGHLDFVGAISKLRHKSAQSVYFFDIKEHTRFFPQSWRMSYCPGDVYFTPEWPSLVKSRLLTADNANSVLMKLDKYRHFMFVRDKKLFAEKRDCAIFRGKIRHSRHRRAFLEHYFGHPLFDCGVVGRNEGFPEAWSVPKMTIAEHLDYKFIIALEGNDVASNLKWVMSSNSIAVMTRPTCETWFMEGTLIPDVHYIEIKEDMSDAAERIQYYIDHPEKAQRIIEAAHAYVEQFFDKRREKLISLMVLDKYFNLCINK